jgi:hypothetical protein
MAANGGAAKHASSVLVLDYGSQYTQLICRRVRELGVYSVMLPGDVTQARRRRRVLPLPPKTHGPGP